MITNIDRNRAQTVRQQPNEWWWTGTDGQRITRYKVDHMERLEHAHRTATGYQFRPLRTRGSDNRRDE